jgi:Sigma-54 interaction domain
MTKQTKLGGLISGETGTGKELVARAFHNLSPHCSNAFVKVRYRSVYRPRRHFSVGRQCRTRRSRGCPQIGYFP